MEDAVKLQTLYPGSNATHIAKQQETVVRSWTALQDRSAHRQEALQASCDSHRFLAQVKLIYWFILLLRHFEFCSNSCYRTRSEI